MSTHNPSSIVLAKHRRDFGLDATLLPYDLAIEQQVLGTLLAHAPIHVPRGLISDAFVCSQHRAIFDAIEHIGTGIVVADADAVIDVLPEDAVENPEYVRHLMAADIGPDNLAGAGRSLMSMWAKRPEPSPAMPLDHVSAYDSTAPHPVRLVLAAAELDDLAESHDRRATEALRAGEGELHDHLECRAFELRRLAERSRAGHRP